jgi:hypothetical protein
MAETLCGSGRSAPTPGPVGDTPQKSHNVVLWPICRTTTFIKPPSATRKRRASSPRGTLPAELTRTIR